MPCMLDGHPGSATRGMDPASPGRLAPAEDSEEESSSEEEAIPQRPAPAAVPRRKKGEEELDPEQMRLDMERLALIRKKR